MRIARMMALLAPLLLAACQSFDLKECVSAGVESSVCANLAAGSDPNYALQTRAIAEQQRLQKPIVSIKARPGENIQISGAEHFEVYANTSNANQVPGYQAPRSFWADIGTRFIDGVFYSAVPGAVQAYQARTALEGRRSDNALTAGIVANQSNAAVNIAGQFGSALGAGLDALGNAAAAPSTAVNGDYYAVGGDWENTNVSGDHIGGDRIDNNGRVQVGRDHIGGARTDNTGRMQVGGDAIAGNRTDNSGRVQAGGDVIRGDQTRDANNNTDNSRRTSTNNGN